MEAMHEWHAKFSMLHAMFHIFMPLFIYLCQDLYVYAMICISMPCFIYLCQFQYLFITIHLCCTNISIFVVLSSLTYVLSTQTDSCCITKNLCCINLTNLCCINIRQQIQFFHHPIHWEVLTTCSSLWSYLPCRIMWIRFPLRIEPMNFRYEVIFRHSLTAPQNPVRQHAKRY